MPSSSLRISRLLTLLLILLLGYLGAYTVNGSPANLGNISEYSKNLSGGPSFKSIYYLYSRCSDQYVQMRLGKGNKALNAHGMRPSQYVRLIFESQGKGLVRVIGEYAQRYLCFNRNGRLILRTHAKGNGRCVFKEQMEENFTMLQSHVNPAWYVGFNKQGKKMKGFQFKRKRRRKCFYFNKMLYTHPKTETEYGPMVGAKIPQISPTVLNNR